MTVVEVIKVISAYDRLHIGLGEADHKRVLHKYKKFEGLGVRD